MLSAFYFSNTQFDQKLTQNEKDEDSEDDDCDKKQSDGEQQSLKSKWRKTNVDLEFVSAKAYSKSILSRCILPE